MFCGIWISTFIGQILIVQFGNVYFSTASLTFFQWTICIFLGLSTLLFGQVTKKNSKINFFIKIFRLWLPFQVSVYQNALDF